MTLAEQYIDRVFDCASKSFPEGLEYCGSTRVSPYEEYREVIRPTYGRHMFELARSDVYLMAYHFKWQGKPLPPRYLYLPFVGQAGTIHLRGPQHTVSPVIADVALSIAKNGIFIPFMRDKVTFSRLPYHFKANEAIENAYVAWSPIHRYAADKAGKVGVTSTLAHYLFCKFGVEETFRMFVGTEVVIGNREITTKNYPESDWVICTTIGIMPKGYKYTHKNYTPSTVALAIRKEHYTELAKSLIAGFFYVADFFPDRMRAEYCHSTRFWRILMGHVIFRTNASEGKLALDIDIHMRSLDEYVDDMVRDSLAQAKVNCNDIYELFIYIIENISEAMMHADLSDMYGKKLMVLRYVLLDITKAIFNLTYKLNANVKKALTDRDIIKAMGKYLNRNLIFNLSKGHGEVNIISSPGDNTMFKHTSNVVLQADATTARKSRSRINLNDPSKWLHVSIFELGSILNLPKSEPTGRSRMNPHMLTGSDGTIMRNPEMQPLLDAIQAKIQR